MNVEAFAISDQGQRRETNEDYTLVDESLGLFIVCDGIGGHAAGEVAAKEAAETAADFIRRERSSLETAGESPEGYFRVLKLAEAAIQEAGKRLFSMACTYPEYSGMGTTLTLLLLVDAKGIMSHVGDSRLYLLRNRELHQLSSDHTVANELLHEAGLTQMTPEIARYNNILTRSLGRQEVAQVDSLLFDVFPNDICLLCSDGLSNYFDDQRAVIEMLSGSEFTQIPLGLVNIANAKGGSDNISLILLRAKSEFDDGRSKEVERLLVALKSTFLCRNLSISRIMRVLNIASKVECRTGQRLLTVGGPCDGFYVMLDGQMLLEDDRTLASDLMPDDFVGATSLLVDAKSPVTLTAEVDSHLLFIGKAEFTKLIRRLPKLGNLLLRNLGEHLSSELNRLQLTLGTDPSDTL